VLLSRGFQGTTHDLDEKRERDRERDREIERERERERERDVRGGTYSRCRKYGHLPRRGKFVYLCICLSIYLFRHRFICI